MEKKRSSQVYIYGTGGGPVNFRRPLEEMDYQIILAEMKKAPTTPQTIQSKRAITITPATALAKTRLTHSELKTMLVELGELFGKCAESEHGIHLQRKLARAGRMGK